jgi:hypothetical protein
MPASVGLSKFWKITYSTIKDLDRGRMKSYDGMLEVTEKDQWLRLKNARGVQISCRSLQKSDHFSIGAKLIFPLQVVRIGTPIIVGLPSTRVCMDHAASQPVLMTDNVPTPSVETLATAPVEVLTSGTVPPIDLVSQPALKLSLSHGRNFSKDVQHKFGSSVHPSDSSGHFLMIVSFGRASFRLNEETVAAALESVIGGSVSKMKISIIRDRVFSFRVSCKSVGFHILKLRMFRCSQFKCFFHLWGRGGPNWGREFNLWQNECDAEWTVVSPGKKRAQMAMKAMEQKVPAPIMRNKWTKGKKLNFAEHLSYPACKGYTDPVAASEAVLLQSDSVQVQQTVKDNAAFAEPISKSVELSKGKEKVIEEPSVPKETLVEHPRNLDGLDEVVDDIAYRFWECGSCLSMGHDSKSCTKRVRCRFCFRSGHFRKTCLDWLRQKNKCWVPKVGLSPQISPDTGPSVVSTTAPGHQD